MSSHLSPSKHYLPSNDKWLSRSSHRLSYIWISTQLHQICNRFLGPQSASSPQTHLGFSNGWVNVMRNNLLWFHVITGQHADTRGEVCISLSNKCSSLPISPWKGLMAWLYCGPPHSCPCQLHWPTYLINMSQFWAKKKKLFSGGVCLPVRDVHVESAKCVIKQNLLGKMRTSQMQRWEIRYVCK